MERARERRLNIVGRNLNADLDVVAPKPPVNARIQAGTPVAGVGCAALADHLRAVAWPSKFRPHLPEKYDGTTNPSEFLQVYVLSVETHRRAATGNTKSREVAGALAGTAPSSTARNPVMRPEVLWKTGRAT